MVSILLTPIKYCDLKMLQLSGLPVVVKITVLVTEAWRELVPSQSLKDGGIMIGVLYSIHANTSASKIGRI